MNDTRPARSRNAASRPWLQARHALAIDALPPALAALQPGAVHAVYADASPARDALFWQSAAQLLRARTTVLSTREPAEIGAMLRQHGLDIDSSRTLHSRANVCTLRAVPDRTGADVLLEAMQAMVDQCGAAGGEILLEGAEAFLPWDDATALADAGARLAHWCAAQGCGLLLLAAPPDGAETLDLATLARFHQHFAGAARLAQVQGQYVWEVGFWRHKNAVLPREVVPLRFSPEDHGLMAGTGNADAADGVPVGLLAPDEHRVIVSRDAVLRERWIPAEWQVVTDNDAAVAAASGAVAATVILHYGDRQQLEPLASQVHKLRHHGGKALKIVVREDKEMLRQRYELLMITLGANLVILRNTPFARMQTRIDSLQGQVFQRPILPDYKSALSAVLATAATGYLPAAEFIALVRGTLERSTVVRLPHVLLELPLLAEVAHVDALRACQMRDAGDLCTAGSNSVYAFFFACRLENVEIACQHVFQRPMSELFSGELRCGDTESILGTLQRLEADIAQRPAQDYSGWLAQHANDRANAPASQPVTAGIMPQPSGGQRRRPRSAPQPFPIPIKPQG
ncbi:cellulose biosynthesis protein BcsE [Cupriavidus pinatubonensis]|uniref:Cellulose biosynthesis protein BcsE n=1 Tax=Cupriavidus pinatubonensis TaxID=248026 RepID=A0ABM8WXT7_9BURK|nr:cellulose biosynthesis protein BcsE [Cupriavidus pinatubonensis]CAG9172372.1 hypothetical protein LMG23994_02375 [Cupriavidus pinatubonensis]